MPPPDFNKSQAINDISCNDAQRYQQIIGIESFSLSYLLLISRNHGRQIIDLTIPLNDSNKDHRHQIIYFPMPHRGDASSRYQQISNHKIVHLAIPQIDTNKSQATKRSFSMVHTETSKPQTTNRTPFHASHKYQQIIKNKSYILPCPSQIPANLRQQIVNLAMHHRQQTVYLAMPLIDSIKSQPSTLTPCHVSHRYQQIMSNKSYISLCRSIIYLAMPPSDTNKSQIMNRIPCHASYRYHQISIDKSYIL